MSEKEPQDSAQDDDLAAFERELEAVLALDPTERINRLTGLTEKLETELKNGEK